MVNGLLVVYPFMYTNGCNAKHYQNELKLRVKSPSPILVYNLNLV